MKKHLLHTNEIDVSFGSYENAERTAREALLEDHEAAEITEDMIWRWLYDVMEINSSAFWDEISHVQDGPWLVIADIGTWMGRRDGGNIFPSLQSAFASICDHMEYVTIEENNHGGVHATCVHHDGRDHFDLYRLSKRGEQWYANNGHYLDRQTICETLAKPHNRRAPHLRKALGRVA